jgi:uncharacterized phage infection (PIP) family protein YhgE
MAMWNIRVSGKGIRRDAVEKIAQAVAAKFGEAATINVTDATPPTSRGDRYSAAQGQIEEGKAEMESLRDELQDWYDNLPEAFQNAEKGEQLQAAIEELETAIGEAEEASQHDVEFPGMY